MRKSMKHISLRLLGYTYMQLLLWSCLLHRTHFSQFIDLISGGVGMKFCVGGGWV